MLIIITIIWNSDSMLMMQSSAYVSASLSHLRHNETLMTEVHYEHLNHWM